MKLTETEIENLIGEAYKAHKNAYCPYSNFPVGASVLSSDGRIFSGCNVENASYGMTICAERNAIFRAVREIGPSFKITAIGLYTPTKTLTAPCGACRQVINEFNPNAIIISSDLANNQKASLLSDLLPDSFGPQNLS